MRFTLTTQDHIDDSNRYILRQAYEKWVQCEATQISNNNNNDADDDDAGEQQYVSSLLIVIYSKNGKVVEYLTVMVRICFSIKL